MTAERPKTRSKAIAPPQFSVNEEELRLIGMALDEDKGSGDWTTRWVVPARTRGHGRIIAKAEGVIAGLAVASAVFTRLDPRVEIRSELTDGARVADGDIVCTIRGPARTILTGERTALNFMQRLSGIATLTRKFVDAVAGTGAQILDTRKTTPGWRSLEKAAVKAGGGENHRFGLFDMVLIKENHVQIAGGVAEAIKRVRDANNKELRVECEVRDKEELRAAVDAGCDIILLDNMDVQAIREAVRVIKQRAPQIKTEASGNMTLERVRTVAETGVDYISVGALTHSVPALDLSLIMQTRAEQ
jgi:nicotinate-nucleotide pyrophosphorylase (carboxylating)